MDQMCTLFYLCACLCYFECYPAITLSGGRRDGGGEARLSRSQRGRQIAVASSVGERWRYLGPAVPRRARERPTGDVCARARRQSAIPPHAVRLPEFGLKLIACRRLRVYDPMVTRSSHASSHFFPSVFNRVQSSHRADATSRQALRRELDAKPGRRGRQSAYSMSVARQTSTPSADPKAGLALATLVWATFAIVPTLLLVRFFLPSLQATSTGGAPGATPRRREATVTAVKEELL